MAQKIRAQQAPRVLLVMEAPIAALLALTLNHGTFQVRAARTVAEGAVAIREYQPHLVIVDLDVAEGIELIGRSSDGDKPVPVIALTRRGDIRTKLAAFERGADDIVTIPFSPEELIARVFAVFRRSYGDAVPFRPLVRVGDLKIDLDSHGVMRGPALRHLTPLEEGLLYLLVANAGRVLNRETILNTLWGSEFVADSNIVDHHVRNLRRKLSDDWRSPRFIETVASEGYRFLDHTPSLWKTPDGNERGRRSA
jgi:DNA-binding response OmpR family regulator